MVFRVLRSIQPAGKALAHLAAMYSIIWGLGYGISTSRWSFQIYRLWRFPNVESHHLAGKLAQAQLASEDVCLLVGPSTVREAFDEVVMQDVAPTIRFLNCGTTGGGIYVYEAMNHLIQQSGVRPKCIVVGLNARMLISREIRVNSAGYTDFLDLTTGRQLVSNDTEALRSEAYEQLRTNTIWPYHRHARHLGRLLRRSIFLVQERLSWHDSLPLAEFEYRRKELGQSPVYHYDDTEPISGEAWDRLLSKYDEKGLFDPRRYAHPEHVESLQKVLDDLMNITPNLILIEMPENSFGRKRMAPAASGTMDLLLSQYKAKGILVVDWSQLLPDTAMRDVGHLLAATRPRFSRDVAQLVTDCLNGSEGVRHEREASYAE